MDDSVYGEDSVEIDVKSYELNNSAIQKFRSRDWNGAEEDLYKALAYSGENNQIRRNLSKVYYEKGVSKLESDNIWEAQSYLRKALDIDPTHKAYQKAYAISLHRIAEDRVDQGKSLEALDYFERAGHVDPENIYIWIRAADYAWTMQQVHLAAMYCEKAKMIDANNQDLMRLESKINDMAKLDDYKQHESEHFMLVMPHKNIGANLMRRLIRNLESVYKEVVYQLGIESKKKYTVIFYPNHQFHEDLEVPHHVQGLYDGKVRLPFPVDGQMRSDQNAVLKHELVHAILHKEATIEIPQWINEGIAQLVEGRIVQGDLQKLLIDTEYSYAMPSIVDINGYLKERNKWAYLKALSFCTFLVKEFGMEKIKNILTSKNHDMIFERRVLEELGRPIRELEFSWMAWILKDK